MIRKLLRRLIIWALNEKPFDVKVAIHSCDAADALFLHGSSSQARKVIINTIKQAKVNREL